MRFLTVSKANPCPICEKADWCSISEDGKYRLCRRVGSVDGRHKQDESGADYWVYSTDNAIDITHVVLPQIPDGDGTQRAAPEDLDRVYRRLLDELDLSDEHAGQLDTRKLSAETVERRMYRSLTANRRADVVKALEKEFGLDLLTTVPGFYVQDGKGIRLGGDVGLLIPVTNLDGQVVALKPRRDDASDGIRYRYMSSKSKDGPGPGAPPHIPHPHADTAKRVRLTEGELKADVATELSDMLTISVAGVSQWRSAIPVLKALKTKTVTLAYDADAHTNRHVALATQSAVEGLRAEGFDVELETWTAADGKGIDDLLASGKRPTVIVDAGVDAVVAQIVVTATEADPTPEDKKLRDKISHAWAICELVAEDIGAPFEPTALDTFAFVRQASTADWQRIRTTLRGHGVSVRELDKAIAQLTAAGESSEDDNTDDKKTRADRPNGLPEIRIDERYMHEISDDAVGHLLAAGAKDPRIFNKGGALVTITENQHGIASRTINAPGMKGILDRTARFVTFTKNGLVPARPPDDVVSDILALEDMPFPPLTAISQAPLVLPSGQLVAKSGYDVESGYVVRLNGLSAVRSDMPLSEAVPLIQSDVFGDFPFVDEPSRAHAFALMLQPFLMALIARPTPLYLIEGPKAGTGKGLLAEMVGQVTHHGKVGTTGQPGEEEEFRKRAFALLLESHTLIWIDNVSKLASSALDRMLTGYLHTDRVLGASRLATVTNNATWLATGNNVIMSDEMARRVTLIRINAEMQNPEERKNFRHPDLAIWVAANRVKLVTACLSIIKAWTDAGMPLGDEKIGSFERWAEVMGGVLGVAGVTGFLGNREMVKASSDIDTVEWEALCGAWWEQYRYQEIRASELLEVAKQSQLLMDLWAGRQDHKGMQRFGYQLKRRRDQVYGRWAIRSSAAQSASGANLYCLEQLRE